MDFGIQFFPAVRPDQKSAAQYFSESLELAERAEQVGFANVRMVEHYFHHYGGYSPNPLLFLSAVAQRTSRVRLVTGAVLPAFSHPLKMASEIAMVDAISQGRLDVGFARAFLPHEFARFGVALDESRGRFEEGVETVRRLLEEEDVALDGEFHSFPPTTTLPRPTQQPRPPFWIAAIATEESFVKAGQRGYNIMAIPFGGGVLPDRLRLYRESWAKSGHEGDGKVMVAFHMFCHEDREEAHRIARGPLTEYLESIVDAASDWVSGTSSADYPGYDKIIEGMRKETFDSQVASGAAWVGTPDDICEQIDSFIEYSGGFEIASLQVNFGDLRHDLAKDSLELFAREVLPRYSDLPADVAIG